MLSISRVVLSSAAITTAGCLTVPASAVTVPFTEHFASGSANWFNPQGDAPATFVPSGGPDGSSHVSTAFNFGSLSPQPIPGNAVNLFRAQDEFNSSGNAFVGDWLAAGVTQFSFAVRHNAAAPLNFFARFATPNNIPAWSAVQFAPVMPNTWTTITFDIAFGNPALFFEGPPPGPAQFNQVFSNIGHVQIGAFAGALAGIDQSITFDLDQPTVAPSPGALAVMALGLAAGPRRDRPHRVRKAAVEDTGAAETGCISEPSGDGQARLAW